MAFAYDAGKDFYKLLVPTPSTKIMINSCSVRPIETHKITWLFF